jgi:DNA-binding NtrC family response regulator
MKVLLVDDERSIRLTLGDALEEHAHTVTRCENLSQGKRALSDGVFDCIITDLQLPDGSGLDLLSAARESGRDASLLVITAHQSIETAIQATKFGADYLIKPFLNEEVIARLQKIDEIRSLRAELKQLRTQVTGTHKIDRIIGKTQAMQDLFKTIETVGPSDASVLITGESGTGKELVAEALHRNSPRCDKRLIKLSCAALPDNLLEDELFGHEKGAYTDAKDRKMGRFELADGGSIFLDDIDDMSVKTQVKLLRVLQEREFERLGGTKTIKIDVRVITATKVDLSLAVRQGRFRDDLYFRLRVIELRLPPLRERVADLPLLIQHFIQRHGGGRKLHVSDGALERMTRYAWPGNVRELENAVMRAVAMAGDSDKIDERFLLQTPAGMQPGSTDINIPRLGGTVMSPESSVRSAAIETAPAPVAASASVQPVQPAPAPAPAVPSAPPGESNFRALRDIVAETEKAYIIKALEAAGGSKVRAAELLSVSRKTLWEKMREHGISSN